MFGLGQGLRLPRSLLFRGEPGLRAMSRCVVNVATDRFVKGQRRLESLLTVPLVKWTDTFPVGAPPHEDVPYAFKPWALKAAADAGFQTLLWADACIKPRDLTPLFERIERDG